MPTVSVIMGIYNCADTLSDAIQSILDQTYTDWELILCDDGSADDTLSVARSFQSKYPDKIILLTNERNLGLNATLNHCLAFAKGGFIARMDGDDICLPNRFEEELRVLEAEPDIAIVSTDMAYFDESGVWGQISHPEYPQPRDFPRGSPFCHAPCMIRKEAYDAVSGYSTDKKTLRVEDYHLWIKMYQAGYRGKNIGSVLYHMRDDHNAYNRRKFRYRINEAYVKCFAVTALRLPVWNFIFALKPILVGLLPMGAYKKLRQGKLGKSIKYENV